MYMPKLGTMLPRNRLACVVVLSVLLSGLASAQTEPNMTRSERPPQSQNQQPAQGNGQAAPGQQGTAPSDNQQGAPAQGQQGGQNPQAPAANDNGVFVFH